jgi:hypothetical protein
VRLAKSVLFCHTVCYRVQAEIEAPLAERNQQQHGASPHEISHGVQPVQMAVGLHARDGSAPNNDVPGPTGMQPAVVDYGATPALVAAGSAGRLDSSGLSALMASGNIDAMVARGLYGDEPRRTLPFCLHMFMASRLQAHSRCSHMLPVGYRVLPFSNDSNDSNDATLLLCTALCAGAILDCLVSPASQGRQDCSCCTARHFIMMQACMQGGRACTMTQG